MMRKKPGVRVGVNAATLHFANRNAYRGMGAALGARSATVPAAARHLEQACARLQDAADELETVLAAMPSRDGRADLREAIGAIMETLQLVTTAQARIEPAPPRMPAAAE